MLKKSSLEILKRSVRRLLTLVMLSTRHRLHSKMEDNTRLPIQPSLSNSEMLMTRLLLNSISFTNRNLSSLLKVLLILLLRKKQSSLPREKKMLD